MKKLLVLLFSILLSFNSYGETYVCAFTCYGGGSETCQTAYKRINNGFLYVDGGDLFNLKENDKFLSLSNNSTSGGSESAGVSVVVINKDNLNFITSRTQLLDVPDEQYLSHGVRKGSCIVVD